MTVVAVFMLVMGAGIAGVWTRDILANPEIDMSPGFFRARDKDSDALFWFHWVAEYGTAAALLAGGAGLLLSTAWAANVSLLE